MLLINTLFLLSLVVWIGGIVFFSFIGAPSIFKALPPEYAGKAVAAIFPKYYPLGYVSGLVAFGCVIFSIARTGHWPIFKMVLLLAMIGLTVYSSLIIHPRAVALREEVESGTTKTEIALLKREFDHTHRVSVIYNGIVLFLGIVLILATSRGLTL